MQRLVCKQYCSFNRWTRVMFVELRIANIKGFLLLRNIQCLISVLKFSSESQPSTTSQLWRYKTSRVAWSILCWISTCLELRVCDSCLYNHLMHPTDQIARTSSISTCNASYVPLDRPFARASEFEFVVEEFRLTYFLSHWISCKSLRDYNLFNPFPFCWSLADLIVN